MTFSEPIRETDLSAGVCIVAPGDEAHQRAAAALRSVLMAASHSDVEILPDETDAISGRHAIALGNMMDNALLRELYFRAYDMTDYLWPGPGGWVIRTVPHSLEGVGHIVVVGASDAQDLPRAAQVLARAVEEGSGALGYQHRVDLGRWAHLFTAPADEWTAKVDTDLELEYRRGAGDWTYMRAIAGIGVLAAQTGREALIELFCQQIRLFAERRWFERTMAAPPCIHGCLRNLMLPFAILENHPALAPDLRADALDLLLGLYRSSEAAGNRGLLAEVGLHRVRQNHNTRAALDLFYGGRYFHQVHGLAEGLAWMKIAEVFFAPQMASNKPVSDSWDHQWSATLLNTADHALASGRREYFLTAPYLEAVDRALIAHSLIEDGPTSYFLMAAAVTGNDEYLWTCGVSDDEGIANGALAGSERNRVLRGNEEPLRSWVTGRTAVKPERLGGIWVAPLSDLFYESIESYPMVAPEGVYQRDVPFEKTFDKVAFRSGWSRDDDYLLLDGISGALHSYQDGNCIVRFTSRGQNWFGKPTESGPASIRYHVGVNVAVDGAGPGCESRYAALRYQLKGEGLSAVGTEMVYPQQADWHRHIVYGARGWFLVIDEVWAKVRGEFLVEARWPVIGNVGVADGVLRGTQGDAQLTMRHVGSAEQALAPVRSRRTNVGKRWVQRSLTRLEPGEGVRFATLLWVDGSDGIRDYVLSPNAPGYRVEGEGEDASVVLSPNAAAPVAAARVLTLPAAGTPSDGSDAKPFAIAHGEAGEAWHAPCTGPVTALSVWKGGAFAGDFNGGVTAFDRGGKVLWSHRLEGQIRAVCGLADGGVAAGGNDETVHRLDALGSAVWSKRLEWQPMNWDGWSWKNVQVLSLASGDINGDGRCEIITGCADIHVYTFDDEGEQLWRSACQWGPPTCLEMAELGDPPRALVLAGLADPAIHGCVRGFDGEGRCVETLSRPDIVNWSIPSWSGCLRVADVDGDGRDEVISGVDTNHRQLIVYGNDGAIRWDADLGGAVLAAEAQGGLIFAGADNGTVQCFEADGARIWSRFLAEPIVGLAPDGAGGCRVALQDGAVAALDGQGEVSGSGDGTARTTAGVWASQWGDGVLLIGDEDGVVRCFGESGAWHGHCMRPLPDC